MISSRHERTLARKFASTQFATNYCYLSAIVATKHYRAAYIIRNIEEILRIIVHHTDVID